MGGGEKNEQGASGFYCVAKGMDNAAAAEADFAYVKSLLEEAIEFGQIRHSPKYCWTITQLMCDYIRLFVISKRDNPHFNEMVFIGRQCIQLYEVIGLRSIDTADINEALDAIWDRKVRGELYNWGMYANPYYKYRDYTAYMKDKLIRVTLPKGGSAYTKARHLRAVIGVKKLPALTLNLTDVDLSEWMEANCPAATVAEVDPIMQNIVFL